MKLPPLACNGCRKCCEGDEIALQPQDNPLAYRTTRKPDGRLVLAKGPDGNCIYLAAHGCSIHGKAPAMCRAFDCRAYYRHFASRPAELLERLANPRLSAVLMEGRDRVNNHSLNNGGPDGSQQ